MGHSSGDTQLVMSLVLVVMGAALFLGGLGSKEWVEDSRGNYTVFFGLWETCQEGRGHSDGCSTIVAASAAAYFEATRTLECLALVVYAVTLCTCFLADDRDPAESCSICVRRYVHAVVAFTAGGLTFLAILIFASCYKDDGWFKDPSLGFSYWLSLAGSLVTIAGGIMRIVFITWPDRPSLPIVKSPALAPQAPAKRTAKVRTDDVLGADPLPLPLRPGEAPSQAEGKKSSSRFKRFLGFFQRRGKQKQAVADISTLCDAVRERQARDRGTTTLHAEANGTTTTSLPLRSAIKQPKPSIDCVDDDDDDDGDETFPVGDTHRRRFSNSRFRTKKRVQIVEPFVGYNIPPTPGPDVPDLEGSSSESGDSCDGGEGMRRGGGEGGGEKSAQQRVKRYQRVVEKEDLRARVVKTPPCVVLPPAYPTATPGSSPQGMRHYLTAKTLMDKTHRDASATSSSTSSVSAVQTLPRTKNFS